MAGLLFCAAIATPLVGQQTLNVAGKWEFTSEGPRGTQTSTITFEQDGTVLKGTMETQRGAVSFENGSVEGNKITFTIVRGMGDRTFEMTYTGTVEGDTMTGTMTNPRGGDVPWTAKKVGN